MTYYWDSYLMQHGLCHAMQLQVFNSSGLFISNTNQKMLLGLIPGEFVDVISMLSNSRYTDSIEIAVQQGMSFTKKVYNSVEQTSLSQKFSCIPGLKMILFKYGKMTDNSAFQQKFYVYKANALNISDL